MLMAGSVRWRTARVMVVGSALTSLDRRVVSGALSSASCAAKDDATGTRCGGWTVQVPFRLDQLQHQPLDHVAGEPEAIQAPEWRPSGVS